MPSVLIVDDQVGAAYADRFRRAGWTAWSAATEQEAQDLLETQSIAFDALVLDRRLVEKSSDTAGDRVLHRLYARGLTAEICVIVLTAYADLESAVDMLENGAWQYLEKPVTDPNVLVQLLAPGVALKKCQRMLHSILGAPTLEDAFGEVQQVVQETLKPDACEMISLSNRYANIPRGESRVEDRSFVRMLRQGQPSYVDESTKEAVQALDPILGDEAQSLLAVPIFRNRGNVPWTRSAAGGADIVGALVIESRQPHAFTARWLEVLRYCADLLGMFETVREARLAHDTILMRELRHRLATSVHVMIDNVAAARAAAGEPPAADSPLAVIGRHVEIVNAVLEEAKEISDGPKVGELRASDLDVIVGRLLQENIAAAEQAHVSLARADTETLKVHADPDALAYGLRCIVRNAFEAIEDRRRQDADDFPATITLSTCQGDGLVRIAVKDNGIGFTKAVATRLFNPLFSTKSGPKNDGIGLYSIRRMIDKMGGRITATSAGPLTGASFEISLPAA